MKTKIANKGNNKKGISLIVLIITIIVMIILAGAIILSISNTNILDRAEQAVDATDLKQVQTLASTLWADAYLNGARTQEDLEKAVLDGLKEAIGEIKLDNYTVTVTESWVTVERKKPEITLDTELSTDKLNPTVATETSYTLSGKVTDKDGIKSFTINGTEVTVKEDGTWSTTLTLTQNEVKEVTIVATNNNGDTTTKVGYVGYIVYTNFIIGESNRSKIGYTDTTTELVIPATFYDEEDGKWYKVTSIGENMTGYTNPFKNCKNIVSVVIPDSVTKIYNDAFYNCSSLTSVTIPDSVTSIGQRAFYGCSSLTNVTILDGVTHINQYAFADCSSLTSVTIPDSVASIRDYAFSGCSSLTSAIVGSGVTSIGKDIFNNCTRLTNINVTSANSVYCSNEGILYNKDMTKLLRYPEGKTGTTYIIPNGVTSIGDSAFNDCSSLTSVTIPNGVTSIAGYTFTDCSSLTSITIPDSVTSIGQAVFRNCSKLTSVTIPDSVTSIGEHAFQSCSGLTSVTISDRVTSIGKKTFASCSSLTNVTIPDSVTSIGEYAFHYCIRLTSVTFENTSGWWVSTSSTATSGTDVDVTDAATAATCLRSTYAKYYWFRSVTE